MPERCAYALAGRVEAHLSGEIICATAERQRLARHVEETVCQSDEVAQQASCGTGYQPLTEKGRSLQTGPDLGLS